MIANAVVAMMSNLDPMVLDLIGASPCCRVALMRRITEDIQYQLTHILNQDLRNTRSTRAFNGQAAPNN